MRARILLLLAGCFLGADAGAQVPFPKPSAKPVGYIVIDSINPNTGRLALALDADGDGGLSRAEIANASVALKRLDRNGDGRLDATEMGKKTRTVAEWQRSRFVAEYGIRHTDCHDIKQALGIPKIITMRVMNEQAAFVDMDKNFSSTVNVQLVGATAGLAEVLPLPLDGGRFLEARDDVHFMPVAVLGADVARKLFPGINPIGKIVKLGTDFYHVIGVLKEGASRPMTMYIPEATMRSRIGCREVRRQSGGLSAREWEIDKAWIPVMDANRADFLLRFVSRQINPRGNRNDVRIQYVPAK